MSTRAMIIVGGGSSTRFGSDKLLVEIEGVPLIAHTIDAIAPEVDTCVVVCREEIQERVAKLRPGVTVATGGSTRTLSEIAGLEALANTPALIGIHDAARPVIDEKLLDILFSAAEEWGGAVPLLDPPAAMVDRENLTPIEGLRRAQTPQVFRGPELVEAYGMASREGFEGHDTADVAQRYTDLTIVGVAGSTDNVKVTYPDDFSTVADSLRARSRI